MNEIPYYHVDVFSDRPFSGNGLTVFTESEGLSKEAMLKLTQEMRQFESIFLEKIDANTVRAYIFTVEEELDFAGHPILGAAATLHDLHQPEAKNAEWTFILNKKTVKVTTEKGEISFKAVMNQGEAQFGKVLDEAETDWLLNSIDLTGDDLQPGCVPMIVSTGLPYLMVPVRKNGLKAKLGAAGLEKKIRAFGAMFIGILEIPTLSIRTGDNGGKVEDIATGSLAGPSGGYLVKYGFQKANTVIQLNQGVNLGRPSQLFVEVKAQNDELTDVFVSGHVYKISQSILLAAKYL
jgi:trans-2,3-dihydro-3-hydroxyanthranilate isomerase